MNNRWKLSLVLLLFITLGVYVDWNQYQDSELSESYPENLDSSQNWILDQESLRGDTIIVIQQDPVFKKRKTFRAFPLKENLLAKFIIDPSDSTLELIFQCKDGYAPHMRLEDALTGNGFLAYKDMSVDPGKNWADSLSEKMPPFYLVWQSTHNQTHVWPYALTEIQLKSKKEAFRAAFPKHKKYYRGFELFSSHCMKCHSVNKVGGTMGPEFNYPTNITTYWTKDNIRRFIEKPTAFRYNSKMPPVQNISDDEFEAIYEYLASMKSRVIFDGG